MSGVSLSEQTIHNGIPLITLRPLKNELPHELVIIYGGTKDKNFRRIVQEKWGEELARRGFTVHCFDFRSNLPEEDFYQFGLWNRLWDATLVVKWLLSYRKVKYPLTLVGVSMGGHLAVQLAADFKGCLANLVLVAPAAYHHDALRIDLRFSPSEGGEFSNILRRSNGWQESEIFKTAKEVKAKTLIIHFFEDEVVQNIPLKYWEVIGSDNKNVRWNSALVGLPGKHAGLFTNPDRIKLILDEISGFLTGPAL